MSPGWRFSGLRRRCANACAPTSSAMPSLSERDSRLYLEDMLRFRERVSAYSEGFDLPGLRADAVRFEAVLRNLELIGEAATHVPAEMRIA